MRSLWALRGHARKIIWLVLVTLLVMGLTAWLNMYSLSRTIDVFKPLFETLAEGTEAEKAAAMASVYHNALLLLLAIVGAALANMVSIYLGDLVGQKVLLDLRHTVYEHLQSLSMSFFDRQRSGELISRLNNDTVILQRALGMELAKMVIGPLTVLFMIGKMLLISWRLTLLLAVCLPIIFAIIALMGRLARRYGMRTQEKLADLTAVSQENFGAMRVIKTFGLEPESEGHYMDAARNVFRAEMKAARVKALSFPVSLTMFGLAMSVTLVYGGYEIMQNRLVDGAAGLMGFLLLMQGAGAQVGSFSRIYLSFQHADAAAARTLKLLAEKPEVADAPDAVDLETVEGRVTFENVRFAYDEGETVLRDFNVDIAPGETVALVGSSGAGKSTVANLIPRLYDVKSGRVLIDGVDVRDVRQQSLKKHMGMVPQETVLFGTSIRNNIALAKPDATDEEIEAAARAASAHEFISRLPEGYETQTGERGVKLSGGQRQRIAIARALLRDPRILILDEATSSLDNQSENAIHEALKVLLRGRTAIIIAHRLSTIRDADRILVLDQGKVVEEGTHEMLMAQDGLYRSLYERKKLQENEVWDHEQQHIEELKEQ